ncbi:MAG: tRNA 2-thiouridine(34) synthase MnmA [Planctomycetota bacterium]
MNASPHKPKVLVAMSGGVDSSVAAALLVRAGYEVVGCFMRLGSPGEALDELIPIEDGRDACATGGVKIGHQGCCSVGDAADARAVAAELGIPLYVVNFKREFGRIMDYFAAEYAAGRTPNPCVRCNDWLKFGKLHEYAEQIGAGLVASGHYARVGDARHQAPGIGHLSEEHTPGGGSVSLPRTSSDRSSATRFELRRGRDVAKDQSYVLFGVPRDRLGHMLLPIGEFETKAEVRSLADEFGLPVFDKPDSQEICFVPDQDYAGFLERRDPELSKPGRIVDTAGQELGTHTGHHRFTIGQRRGVGVALGYPIYVTHKDPATNTVTVGTEDDLMATGCIAGELNWLSDYLPTEWTPCLARHRYNGEAVPGAFRAHADIEVPAFLNHSGRSGGLEVRFDAPERAVTAGQAIVVYSAADPDLVLGGGWIVATTPRTP